jgi:hypothetical protein
MVYTVDMGLGAMICIQSSINIGSGTMKFIKFIRGLHRDTGSKVTS